MGIACEDCHSNEKWIKYHKARQKEADQVMGKGKLIGDHQLQHLWNERISI